MDAFHRPLFYHGVLRQHVPGTAGDLLSTTLKARHLRHVEMDGNQPVAEHELLGDLNERLRFIHTSMDGSLYLLTDSGKLLHLTSPD
nr:PQQ-dependent sugar dehydrogenase [Aliamphritea spongicola]